jgi:ketosteroid isomerase-like protein
MRHIFVGAIFVFTIWFPALGRQTGPTMQTVAMTSVEQTLIELEKAWNAAFLRKDLAALERIMADDIVIVYGDGSRATKAKDLAGLGKGEQVTTSTQDEFQVRVYGDAAVVMSRLTSTGIREGKRFSAQFRYIDVFEKRDGRWQCTMTQNTHIGKVTL